LTYEEVHEEWANVATVSPVDLEVLPVWLLGAGTGNLLLLPGPATTPNGEGEDHEEDVGDLGLDATAGLHVIESETSDDGSDDLFANVRKGYQSKVENIY
jgi:hypothetical protein